VGYSAAWGWAPGFPGGFFGSALPAGYKVFAPGLPGFSGTGAGFFFLIKTL